MEPTELSKAVSTLIKELNNDPLYRYGWQSNIAMAFLDEWNNSGTSLTEPPTYEEMHQIANDAASRFLITLTSES